MNQLTKTGIFAGAAVLAIVLAVVASMERRFGNATEDGNDLLFKDMDPKLAQSMEIVKYDEDISTQHEFKVAQTTDDKGRRLWVITSHNNYPADANTQLAGAASALIDKQRGPRVSSDRNQHATYGVLDPSEEGKAGEKGMGTLVVFADEGDKKLAELIVGKPVKDRPSLRYVRVRGENAVYQVDIDAGKFSTKFEDWIERDLLKLEASRIKEVTIRDLDIAGNKVETKGLLQLKYDNNANENRWELAGLSPGEKLEEAKLNDMRNAFGELKIVDVHKKPAALADLLTGKTDRQHTPVEMLQVEMSLKKHGFLIGRYGIVPSDGVVNVQLEDGLEYALYFGGIASLTADQSEAGRKEGDKKEDDDKKESDDKKEGDKKEGDKKDDTKTEGEKKDKATGSNRYVFVSVQLNEDFVKKPELKPLPGESLLPAAKAADKDKKEADANEPKAKPGTKPKKAALADAVKELRRLNEEGLIDDKEWEQQHKEAERANERAQEKYDSDLKAARKKEKELNERFADWYYVIDDGVYKKIRLKHADIVKATEKPKDEKPKDAQGKDEKSKGEKSPAGTGKEGAKPAKAAATKTP